MSTYGRPAEKSGMQVEQGVNGEAMDRGGDLFNPSPVRFRVTRPTADDAQLSLLAAAPYEESAGRYSRIDLDPISSMPDTEVLWTVGIIRSSSPGSTAPARSGTSVRMAKGCVQLERLDVPLEGPASEGDPRIGVH